MLINLESRLERIQEMLEEKDSEVTDFTSGTLAVIEGDFEFQKTDGFIAFLLMTLDYIPTAYGKQKQEWEECLHRIMEMAEKLMDANTRFTGSTRRDFKAYCRNLSQILKKELSEHMNVPKLTVVETLDLLPVMEKYVHDGYRLGFHYEGHGEPADIMHDLIDQLSRLKMKKMSRRYNISNFLITTGYHEHVHDALNVLIQCGVYAVNCSSTKKRAVLTSDLQEIISRLQYVELIMERTEYLV